MANVKIFFNHREELWNSWTHAAGIMLGVATGVVLLVRAALSGDPFAVLGVALYVFGMLSSYVSSTSYHALSAWSPWKQRLRKWDHAAIYWHIAGAYSPLTLIALRHCGAWGWGMFAFIWAAALAGTIVSFARLGDHSRIETACFVAMGLSILVAFGPLMECVSTATVAWIIGEGVCYIVGALFYLKNKRRFMHTVFHFFVLAGTLCHLVAVFLVVFSMK